MIIRTSTAYFGIPYAIPNIETNATLRRNRTIKENKTEALEIQSYHWPIILQSRRRVRPQTSSTSFFPFVSGTLQPMKKEKKRASPANIK